MSTPRCIVEIRWGKLAGTKVTIEAGSSLHVGRTDRAGLAIPHDGKMSHVHFELDWDGKSCTLKDLGSIAGTKLGGLAVTEADVPHGGWIQAGDTDLMVYFEGHTPPPDDGAEELDAAERRDRDARLETADDALEALRAEAAKDSLYAIVDTARDDRILELLREHVEPHRSLYEGAEGESLDEVAPYLVGPMRPDSALLEKLVMEGWGRRWGIWCTSQEPFREVRRHWRRFLMVELEETGERVYFRFYDPTILRRFMEASSPPDLRASRESPERDGHLTRLTYPLLRRESLFRVSPLQYDIFADYCRSDFEQQALEHARRSYPEASRALSEQALRKIVIETIESANMRAIDDSLDVFDLVALNVLLGPGFEKREGLRWAASILDGDHPGVESKVERVKRILQERMPALQLTPKGVTP